MDNEKCKFCREPIPRLALHFSNQIAIELGYCCFMCMDSNLGEEKAYSILGDKYKQGTHECASKGLS